MIFSEKILCYALLANRLLYWELLTQYNQDTMVLWLHWVAKQDMRYIAKNGGVASNKGDNAFAPFTITETICIYWFRW